MPSDRTTSISLNTWKSPLDVPELLNAIVANMGCGSMLSLMCLCLRLDNMLLPSAYRTVLNASEFIGLTPTSQVLGDKST